MGFNPQEYIAEDTEVVNNSDTVGYAEAHHGPWTVEYEIFPHRVGETEHVRILGPFIEIDGRQPISAIDTADLRRVLTNGGWDYVEMADARYDVPEP